MLGAAGVGGLHFKVLSWRAVGNRRSLRGRKGRRGRRPEAPELVRACDTGTPHVVGRGLGLSSESTGDGRELREEDLVS